MFRINVVKRSTNKLAPPTNSTLYKLINMKQITNAGTSANAVEKVWKPVLRKCGVRLASREKVKNVEEQLKVGFSDRFVISTV